MKKIPKIIDIWNKNNIMKSFIQFFKFGIVGLANTSISLGVYYFFLFFSKKLYIIGYIVGFIVSVFNAYYWNSKYVFRKTEKGNVKPLIKSVISYGSTLILSTIMLYILVNYLNVSKTIVPIINLIITIPLNFLLNKFWIFS